MKKRISNKDLDWLIDTVQKRIRYCCDPGSHIHGEYFMIANCLDELKSFRKNANTVKCEIDGETLRKMVETAVNERLYITVTCPGCGKEFDLRREKEND